MIKKALSYMTVILCISLSVIQGFSTATNSDEIDIINGRTDFPSTDWWPMYHHDQNLTGYSTSTGPTTNKVLWAAEAFDGFWYDPQRSSPAIVNDSIYIGVCDPSRETSASESHDRVSSRRNVSIKKPFNFEKTQEDNPLLDRWYEAYLICMNTTTGVEKWKTRLGTEEFIRGSPAVAAGKVYITTTENMFSPYGQVFCVDASTGDILWDFPLNGEESFSPVVENGHVYVAGWILGENSSKVCRLFCLDAIDGSEVFNKTLGTGEPVDAASIHNNRVYISVWDDIAYKTFLYCVNSINGSLYWMKNLPGNYWVSAPVLYDGKILVISSSYDFLFNFSCYIECFDAITGAPLWDVYVAGLANTWSTPAIAYNKIYCTLFYISPDYYVPDEKGWLYCLDATTGNVVWNKCLTQEAVFVSSPAVAEGKIYVNSMGYQFIHGDLYCIDATTGETMWQYWLLSPIYSSPAVAGGRVYLAAWDYFYAFDDAAPYDAPPVVTIDGPQYGIPGIEYNYTMVVEDPEGHDLKVIFEWSREWPSGYYSWNSPSGDHEVLTLPFEEEGEYWLRAKAQDRMKYTWSDWAIFTINISENNRPSTPTITGPPSGKPGRTYEYTLVSTNPNDDDLWYFIDWGDGTNSSWIGPSPSNQEVTQSHSWSEKGTYTIQCKSKDAYHVESDWGTLQVTMPTSVAFDSLFLKLLEKFPHAFPILRLLMGL